MKIESDADPVYVDENMKRDDLHIKILKYGFAHAKNGFTINELRKDLSLSETEFRFLDDEIRGADIVAKTGTYRIPNNFDWSNQILILSFEAQFKLIQYTALQEARWTSVTAILIGILALSVTFYYSKIQAIPIIQNLAKEERSELTFCLKNTEAPYTLPDDSTTTCKIILRQKGYLLDQNSDLLNSIAILLSGTTSKLK